MNAAGADPVSFDPQALAEIYKEFSQRAAELETNIENLLQHFKVPDALQQGVHDIRNLPREALVKVCVHYAKAHHELTDQIDALRAMQAAPALPDFAPILAAMLDKLQRPDHQDRIANALISAVQLMTLPPHARDGVQIDPETGKLL